LPPNDFTGDTFEPGALSANTLESDVELAVREARPELADTVCRSYHRPSPFLRQGEGPDVVPNVTLDFDRRADFNASTEVNGTTAFNGSAEVNAQEIVMLGKELKTVCFGSTWNGDRCFQVVNAIRHFSWARLMSSTTGVPTFSHLRTHRDVPTVKFFSQGGGTAASVKCRSDGGKGHLYYRHIFKAAGMAITKNLAIINQKDPDVFIDAN